MPDVTKPVDPRAIARGALWAVGVALTSYLADQAAGGNLGQWSALAGAVAGFLGGLLKPQPDKPAAPNP